jgi:hypothetical protein
MQSPLRSQVSGWVGVAGAAGMLVSVLMLSGCPGTLDPTQFNTNGTGGSGSGTGGSNPTGGSTGTGGSSGNCTGNNDPVAIIMTNCATASCHIPGPLNDGQSGGLDLTVDANIGSRLVDVMSTGTTSNNSSCMGNTEPYLQSASNPATGLLIDKISSTHPPCGSFMPYASPALLPAAQRTCLIQWATTLTSP